jgi:hypothetical protein
VQQRRAVADAAALLAAADAEADAVADRLHDGALQALVVARYAADAAVRGGDPALARDAVQEALVALRRAVWDLRPRGGGDLASALGELAQRRAAAGAGALELHLDAAACARLSGAARAAAYRFVQAALPSDRPAVVSVTDEGRLRRRDGRGHPRRRTGLDRPRRRPGRLPRHRWDRPPPAPARRPRGRPDDHRADLRRPPHRP